MSESINPADVVNVFSLAALRGLEASGHRATGYVDDVLATAVFIDGDRVGLAVFSERHRALQIKYAPDKVAAINRGEPAVVRSVETIVAGVEAIPRFKWPLPARVVARFANDEDIGVGDTLHRMLGTAGDTFTALSEAIGVDCGCAARQAWMNQRYPYTQ